MKKSNEPKIIKKRLDRVLDTLAASVLVGLDIVVILVTIGLVRRPIREPRRRNSGDVAGRGTGWDRVDARRFNLLVFQ